MFYHHHHHHDFVLKIISFKCLPSQDIHSWDLTRKPYTEVLQCFLSHCLWYCCDFMTNKTFPFSCLWTTFKEFSLQGSPEGIDLLSQPTTECCCCIAMEEKSQITNAQHIQFYNMTAVQMATAQVHTSHPQNISSSCMVTILIVRVSSRRWI